MEENKPDLKEAEEKKYQFQTIDNRFLPCVLYVEEDQYHIQLVKKILDHLPSITILTASTSESCLQIALRKKPELILVNLNLRGCDAFELMVQLQQHPMTRNIPVFALSTSALPHEVEKADKAGFKRFLSKPVKTHEFFNSVNAELEDIFLKKQLRS
ncbi:MAG: response regulator [Gammaproteobacteria bacterium]|nr:response regulator [Gammaproteobacteria bacterium]